MDTELVELVRSIYNRCRILLALSVSGKMAEVENSIPTLLEDMCEDAQTIATEHCTEREDD